MSTPPDEETSNRVLQICCAIAQGIVRAAVQVILERLWH